MSEIKRTIPKKFYSDSEGKPFTKCRVCDVDLSDGKVPYSIEKAFKKTEEGEDLTLFELAICVHCAEKQGKKMSKDSRAFIQKTMMTPKFFERRNKMWGEKWQDKWQDKCIFSNTDISAHSEYHVVGHFVGNQVIEHQSPFVIGQEMLEYIHENLSLETKEELDQFGRQFLGPDPRIAALMEDYQFVMV